MVSIPDWSRFQRGGFVEGLDGKQRHGQLGRDRHEKAIEAEAIKRAEEKGYFCQPRAQDLVHRFSSAKTRHAFDTATGQPTDRGMAGVRHIKLCYSHMKSFGDIGRFLNLRILDVSNNYILHLEPLAPLRFLMKLDAHSNQISLLPDAPFWSDLPLLEILLLHDNPIGRVETIHSLAVCPSLLALTLYDSPLSLKKNYRHHVVNTVWTLKALDWYIVSDEEIIEDAIFKGSRFSAMHKDFEVDLCPRMPKSSSFEEEWKSAQNLVQHINRVMAKFCPVLILQKMIRSWLTRKRFQLYMDSRDWGAVTIQRQWRRYKNRPPPAIVRVSPPGTAQDVARKSPSKATPPSVYSGAFPLVPPSAPNPSTTTTPRHSAQHPRKRNLIVDLAKLQEGPFANLDEMTLTGDQYKTGSLGKKPMQKMRRPVDPPKRRRLMSVKQFFGPVVQPGVTSPRMAVLPDISGDDTIPTTSFRLTGYQPAKHNLIPIEEVILARKEAGQDIRDMQMLAHDQMAVINAPPTIEPRNAKVKDKFMYARLKETMGLSLLAAVHHAYRDRENELKMGNRIENVLAQQEKKLVTRERIRLYQSERRSESLRGRDADRKQLLESAEAAQGAAKTQQRHTRDQRAKREQLKARARADAAFTQEFRTQQTSVSKALLRHDRQAKKESIQQKNVDKVEGLRASSQEQREIVTKFLEHRALLRQTETAMTRAALDARILQETSTDLMESRKRVEQLKNRTQQVQRFYPLPHIPVSGLPGATNNTPAKTAASSSLPVQTATSSLRALPAAGPASPHIRFRHRTQSEWSHRGLVLGTRPMINPACRAHTIYHSQLDGPTATDCDMKTPSAKTSTPTAQPLTSRHRRAGSAPPIHQPRVLCSSALARPFLRLC